MGLAAPAMAQDVNYKDALKPIETTLKAGNVDAKAFAKTLKEYQKEYKKDPKALVALGNALVINKDYTNALAVADAVIAKFKNYGDAYILKGDIYAMQDNGGEAATWYGQCMTMDPKNPQGYISYANVYRKIDPQASAEALNKLREVDPNYPIEAETGHNYYSIGNYEKAYENFTKANLNTMEEYIYYEYCFTAYVLDKKEDALKLCKQGIQKYPNYGSFNRVVLYASDKQKNYPTAVEYGDKLFAATDTVKYTANDYTYYADALLNVGRIDDAITAYKHIPEVDPENKEVNKLIAMAYSKGKQFNEAVAAYNKYLEVMGDEITYKDYDSFADIYLEQAEAATTDADKDAAYKNAADMYGKIAEKFDYAAIYAVSKQATAYYQINPDLKVGASLPYYSKLIELINAKDEKTASDNNKLITAYNYLAVHYIQNDKVAEAKKYAEKLLELSPENETGKQIMNLK